MTQREIQAFFRYIKENNLKEELVDWGHINTQFDPSAALDDSKLDCIKQHVNNILKTTNRETILRKFSNVFNYSTTLGRMALDFDKTFTIDDALSLCENFNRLSNKIIKTHNTSNSFFKILGAQLKVRGKRYGVDILVKRIYIQGLEVKTVKEHITIMKCDDFIYGHKLHDFINLLGSTYVFITDAEFKENINDELNKRFEEIKTQASSNIDSFNEFEEYTEEETFVNYFSYNDIEKYLKNVRSCISTVYEPIEFRPSATAWYTR